MMKTHTKLKMRKGIFKLTPSVKQCYQSNNEFGTSFALRLPFQERVGTPVAMLLAFWKN